MSKPLPQDDICYCGRRIGDHSQWALWSCLQEISIPIRQVTKRGKRNEPK